MALEVHCIANVVRVRHGVEPQLYRANGPSKIRVRASMLCLATKRWSVGAFMTTKVIACITRYRTVQEVKLIQLYNVSVVPSPAAYS